MASEPARDRDGDSQTHNPGARPPRIGRWFVAACLFSALLVVLGVLGIALDA